MGILHQSFHRSVILLCESITLEFIYLLTYLISSVRNTASGWEGIQSMGEGIEREVLQTAFQAFQDHPTVWFLQRQDTHSLLMTLGLQRR